MAAKKAPKGNAERETNRRDMFDDVHGEEGMDTQELLVELARLRASHKVICKQVPQLQRARALARDKEEPTWIPFRGLCEVACPVGTRLAVGFPHQRRLRWRCLGKWSDRQDSVCNSAPKCVSTAGAACRSVTGV